MSGTPQNIIHVSTLFAPFIRTPDEVQTVRARIAEYIESLKPRHGVTTNAEPIVIPAHVTGNRRQYLQALQRNIEAQQRYSNLQAECSDPSRADAPSSSLSNTTSTHLELLRLQKDHQQYGIISHYLTEAENLAERNYIFQSAPTLEPASSRDTEIDAADASALAARAQELLRKLEIAILQANHRLKREARLLENIKARRHDNNHATPTAKLHALLATRAELTAWIEESLAKCDIDKPPVSPTRTDHTQLATNHRESINRQYERYLEARKRLLTAASALATSLPRAEEQTRNVVSKPNAKPELPPPAIKPRAILPHITTRNLPHLRERQALAQLQTYLTTLLSTHNSTLLSQLHRLSDESHLLPSYPILAQTKPMLFSQHVRSKSSGNDRATDYVAEMNSSEMEIARLLEHWRFAIEAAATATEATVQKQITDGVGAVADTKAIVDDVKAENATWKKLVES